MLTIGPYDIESPLILAPMAGVTDRPFRQLCRQHGAGLAVSEMVIADPSFWKTRKSKHRLDHRGEDAPVSVQIAGGDPDMLATAARMNQDMGAQIIDINMGCPAKKVCNKAAGSALLRDEKLVANILEAVVSAVQIPVTLKIRTGWDTSHRNALTVARIAEQSGIQALAIHGRTRACGYRGEAEYDTIAAVKAQANIPILANGDINSPHKARQVLTQTGADGLLIGRAAQGRPWIFDDIRHFLKTGVERPARSQDFQRDILMEHVSALHEFYGETMGPRIARKHVSWYLKTQPNHSAFRQRFNTIDLPQEQLEAIKDFFEQQPNQEEQAA